MNTNKKRDEILREYENYFKKISQKRPYNRHPAKKRRKTDTTEKKTGAYSFPKCRTIRIGEINREETPGRGGQNRRNLLGISAVIFIEKDKSVDIALNSRNLNEACIKKKTTMPGKGKQQLPEFQQNSRRRSVKDGCPKIT